MRPTVSLDFDGVLHCFSSGWTGYEPCDGPEPGALGFVTDLIDAGYDIVVVSSRAHIEEGRVAIERWLDRHEFPPLHVTNEKIIAVAYVDDRAVPYRTGSGLWSLVMRDINTLAQVAATQDR